MDRAELDIHLFMDSNKSMIIAPAGYGKTHTIVDCLEKFQFEDKKILILTHTHAGIASIKTKIADRNIDPKIYEINTICSFTLNLTLAYVPASLLPDDSDMNKKYQKAQGFARQLLAAKPIKSVLQAKYAHIIVDVYQDCNTSQHQLIDLLGQFIKVHILGDHMQGIFGFNGTPVDLNSSTFDDYRVHIQTLNIPWRWNNAGAKELGEEIHKIRNLLEGQQQIDLYQYKHIQFVKTHRNDLYWHGKSKSDTPPEIITLLRHYLSDKHKGNVLIIHPLSFNKDSRVSLTKNLYNLGILESIDDSDFYDTVNEFENKSGNDLIASIKKFLQNTCAASVLSDWLHEDGSLVNVRKEGKLSTFMKIKGIVESLQSQKSASLILSTISQLKQLLNIRIVRNDVYYTIQRVLIDADRRNISLRESLKHNRDAVRRIGRSITGKYIGTTLLTKGLECETVIVLNAHQFPDEKHLYVALSRCSKKLIVASESAILPPNHKKQEKATAPDAVQPSLFSDLDY